VAYVLRGSEMDFGDIVVTYLDEDRTVDITHDDVFQGEAQWSPDGRVLAFSSFFDGDLDIYLLDVETGDLRQLTNNDADDMRPAWSPDGKQIVFASDRDGDFEIYVINVDGTNIRQLTDNHAEDHQPRWWGPPVPNVHVDISNAPRPKFTGPTGAPA
jgi:Tol biopolymer transport system component